MAESEQRLQFLLSLMEVRGVSKHGLARIMGVSPQNIFTYFKRDDMKLSVAQEMASRLGYDLSYRLEKEDGVRDVVTDIEGLVGKDGIQRLAFLRVAMKQYGIERKKLAEQLGLNYTRVNRWFKVDIEDEVSDEGEVTGVLPRMSYKQSVLDFLSKNRDLPVLQKIYDIEQLTSKDFMELERILWEELGSKEDYNRFTHGMPCGSNVAIFVRSMVGVDRKNAVRRFSQFISGNELNAEQEDFLMTIISYVCENGDITKEIVVNEAPFDERLTVFTPYMLPLAKYIDNIHAVVTPMTA
jgi:type I restriction enzyme R subunit